MTLVSLAYTKAEQKEEAAEYATPKPPEYPWGLSFRLEDEELKKLGIDMPEVGGELHMEIVAKVTSTSQNQMSDGSSDRCVCLQITMASVELEESAADEKGEKETPAAESAETRKTPSLLRAR